MSLSYGNQTLKINNIASPNITNLSSNIVNTNKINSVSSNVGNTETNILCLGLDTLTITGGGTGTLSNVSVTQVSNGGSGYPTFNLNDGLYVGQLKTVMNLIPNKADYVYVFNINLIGNGSSSTMYISDGYLYLYGYSSVTLIWNGTNWMIYSAYNSNV